MADFYIKQGDRHPELAATLTREDGTAVVLTGATVTFSMKSKTGTLKVNAASVTVVSATDGTVKYSWASADTDTPGFYFGEFKVTFSDTRTARFPNKRSLEIQVQTKVN